MTDPFVLSLTPVLELLKQPACVLNSDGIVLTNSQWVEATGLANGTANTILTLLDDRSATDFNAILDNKNIQVQAPITSAILRLAHKPAILCDISFAWSQGHLIVTLDNLTEERADFTADFGKGGISDFLLETIPAPVFVKDINHIYTACNDEFLRMLGMERQEIIGKNVYDVAPSDNARIYREADEALFEKGGRQIYETVIHFSDGANHDVVFHKSVFFDNDGNTAGLIGIILDITSRKQAEKSLQENEALLQAIVNNSPAYIFVKDLEGKYIVSGNRFTDKVGWPRGYLQGKTDYEIFPKKVAHFLRENDRKVLEAQEAISEKESFTLEDREITNLAVKFPLYDSEKNLKGVAGIAIDVSDLVAAENKLKDASRQLERQVKERTRELEKEIRTRKQAENKLKKAADELEQRVKDRTIELEKEISDRKKVELALREREAQFEASANSASDWFWGTDENHCFNSFSERLEEIAGIKPYLLIGKPRWESKGISLTEEEWEQHRKDLQAHKPFRDFRFDVKRPDGTTLHASISGTPIFDDDGKFVGYRGAGRDVSEEIRAHKAEQQLHQSQKMEAIGQLTGGVAHDFNNILAIILGNIDLIKDDLTEDNPLYPLTNAIERSASRGAQLTQRLLAYSRKQALRPMAVDLNQLTGGMLDMMDRLLGETIEIHTTLCPKPHPVFADPGQIENALMNLCINSSDAMPDGGDLYIETGSLSINPKNALDYPDLEEGEFSWLQVKDTGRGMDEETLEHAFEPFFTTKEVGKGTGLGLSMVYGFAQQSKGTVKMTSQPGEGTTATLILPTSKNSETSN